MACCSKNGCAVRHRARYGPVRRHVSLYLDMVEKQLTYDALKIIGFDPALAAAIGEMRFLQSLAQDGKIIQGLIVAQKRSRAWTFFARVPGCRPSGSKRTAFTARGVWLAPEATLATVADGVCAFAEGCAVWPKHRRPAPSSFRPPATRCAAPWTRLAMRTRQRTFFFNLPATWQTAAARRLFHAELERLGRFLERLGGQMSTGDAKGRSFPNTTGNGSDAGHSSDSLAARPASPTGSPWRWSAARCSRRNWKCSTKSSRRRACGAERHRAGERNLLPPGPQPGTDRGRASEVQAPVQPLGCREPVRKPSTMNRPAPWRSCATTTATTSWTPSSGPTHGSTPGSARGWRSVARAASCSGSMFGCDLWRAKPRASGKPLACRCWC